MFRLFRRLLLLVITAVVLLALVPPPARPLPPLAAGTAAGTNGIVHVHTMRSDGTGSIDDVTAAAARAGLKFVVVTDHGDATRDPDSPSYRNGVLYIDAVEIGPEQGHLVAIGLPKAPYPLRGEARDVLDDIARLGGLSIAAHPGSPKADLRWTAWDQRFDGIEWLNADSEWRDEQPWTLARALLTYPFRPSQSLALLLDRPSPVMAQWDRLTGQRRVLAIAGSDAHARVGLRTLGEPYDTSGSFHFPSYQNSFREFSITLPGVTLSGDAAADAQLVVHAIRAGAVYSTIDALAGPATLTFTATSGGRVAAMGEALPLNGPVTLLVHAQAPGDAAITLFQNGIALETARGVQMQREVAATPAVYRVEVTLPGSPGTPPVPWLVSNPIYVGRADDKPLPPAPTAAGLTLTTVYEGGQPRDWTIEKSSTSEAAIDVANTLGGTQLLLRFALSGLVADHPYAAFVMPATTAVATQSAVVFTARADRPMRLSVQLRTPGGQEGVRWRRSIYLDKNPRTIELPFNDFTPADPSRSPVLSIADVQSILFVADTINTKVGTNGQVWLDDIRYAK